MQQTLEHNYCLSLFFKPECEVLIKVYHWHLHIAIVLVVCNFFGFCMDTVPLFTANVSFVQLT